MTAGNMNEHKGVKWSSNKCMTIAMVHLVVGELSGKMFHDAENIEWLSTI